jgi:hypothetical protein
MPLATEFLNHTEAWSDSVGRLSDRIINRFVKTRASATCGIYCYLITCHDTAYCPYLNAPNSFRCHNACTGTDQDWCFPNPCSGFCWHNQC